MMRAVYKLLLVLAGAAFVIGILIRLLGAGDFMGQPPLTLWRFSVSCVVFAIALLLMDIRDLTAAKS
jgi:hypothetical protein